MTLVILMYWTPADVYAITTLDAHQATAERSSGHTSEDAVSDDGIP
jgi:hypothetical protein